MATAIPDFGREIPKKYRQRGAGDIEQLGIKALFRMIVLGPSFSGKNNLCMFILKHSPHVFSHLHIIARNPHQELYEYLRDKLEGFVTFYDTPPTVDTIRRTPMKKPELVIIDDYSNDKGLQRLVFSHYFTRGRHFKLSTIFLSHSYFGGTEKLIRLNAEYVAILKANSKRDLQLIVKDFNIPGVDDAAIVRYYNKATAHKGQMLFVDSVNSQLRGVIYESEMSSFLKIDSTNLVQNGLNNQWRYSFVGSSVNFQDVVCAIQSISMYNSQFNIDGSAFNNTSFKVEVPTAATTSNLTINLPDGYFSYDDINRVIQTTLINAGAYLLDASGNNVFYIRISANATYYSCQLDVTPVPTSLPTGYTRPATGLYSTGGSGLPTVARAPRLIIDNAAFGSVLGFSLGTYPSANPTTTVTSVLSNLIPQIHPSSSYIVRCDLVKNDYVVSGDILAAFDRGDAGIGQLIHYSPSEYAWMNCHNGPRSSITITIYDQNDRPVHFRDLSVSIMLLFRSKK